MEVIPSNSTIMPGFSQPPYGFWSPDYGLPTDTFTCIFNTGTIGTIIGAPANTTIGPDGSNISFLSTQTPQGSPVNSLIMRCDIISNDCINPSDIVDSVPINNTFGSNIIYNPTFPKWIKMNKGVFTQMNLYFCDQNYNPVIMNDPNLCLTLLIRKKNN